MQNFWLRRAGTLLGAALLLSSCAPKAQWQTLPNGLKYQVVPNQSDDIAKVLDLRMWNLKVVVPKPSQQLKCELELREKGRMAQVVGGVMVGPFRDTETEVFVGLHPLGDSWPDADKFKAIVRIGSGSSTALKNNFFRGLSYSSGAAALQQDGSFLLMAGRRGQSPKWPQVTDGDLMLVLKLTLMEGSGVAKG